MALLEAMSAGLPCIATSVGAIPKVLDGANGMVVPPGDADEFAQAMLKVATTPGLALSIGASARKSIQLHFSIDRTVDSYLRVLGLPVRWPVETSS